MERHDIGEAQQFVPTDDAGHRRRSRAGVGRERARRDDDLEPEGRGALCHRPAGGAEPDDPEHEAAQPSGRVRRRGRPSAAAGGIGGRNQVAKCREGEREGVVGDLLGAELGDVADQDAELGRVVDVDVVNADTVAGDRETPRRRRREPPPEPGESR